MGFIQDEDLPCILAQVESVQESMATVQITLQHLQGELHEGFQILRSEMETGREQASQEFRLLGLQISKLLELRASLNMENQRPPGPSPYPSSENSYPSSENCGQPRIPPSCPHSFCGFPSPSQGVLSLKTKSDCVSKHSDLGK